MFVYFHAMHTVACTMAESGVAAIFGPNSPKAAGNLYI